MHSTDKAREACALTSSRRDNAASEPPTPEVEVVAFVHRRVFAVCPHARRWPRYVCTAAVQSQTGLALPLSQ